MKFLDDKIREIYRDEISKVKELKFYFDGGISGIREEVDGEPFSMHFYQVEGADLLCDAKRILIADEMGTGKTLQAIAGKMMLENKYGKKVKTLIISPNSVKGHWYKELHKYCEKERIGTVQDVKGYSNVIDSIEKHDFTILNYDAFSFGENGNKRKLMKALLEAGFNYTILDEVHNAKNPKEGAYRSKNVKEIADASEYLCLLSGTPIPNNLRDTYMLISLLEPHVYRTPQEVAAKYASRPDLIRVVLGNRMLRRQMKDIKNLPELHDSYHWIELSPEQKKLYDSIYENNYFEGSRKLELLRAVLLNPMLLSVGQISSLVDDDNRKMAACMESTKFMELDKLIQKNLRNGEKTIIFSPIRRGYITKELENRYREHGALRMDGENPEKRSQIQEDFQTNDRNRILIATDVAGEGISLTAGSRCIFLEDPFTHAERDQMIAREHRPGQTRPVYATTIAVPETMDEGVKELIEQKRKISRYIVDEGRELSPEEKRIFSDLSLKNVFFEETATRRWLYTPQQYVMRMSNRMAGKSEKAVIKAVNHTPIGKKYADDYCNGWNESYQSNVAEAYKRIIKALEKKNGRLERKLDTGSAFGVLSHALGERTTNIDINMYHFLTKMGKKDNNNITASMLELPLKDEYFDLVLSSLSLHHPEEKTRSKAIREANRVLRSGGYYLFALHSYLLGDLQKLDKELISLGFETIPELSGFVESREPEGLEFKAYLHTARKTGEPGDSGFTLAFGNKKSSMKRDGIVTEFNFIGENGKEEPFEEKLRKYIERK